MNLKVKLSNRAALCSGEDIRGNRWTFDCEVNDFPNDVRKGIAERLVDDTYVCVVDVTEDGSVEPRLAENECPDLLCLDGTEVKDLIDAVRRDQAEVQACRAELAVTEG